MEMTWLALLDPKSVGASFRTAGTRLIAPLPKLLAATREKFKAAIRAVKEFLVLPPLPIEGTSVVISDLSARFIGTTCLAIGLGLPAPIALLLTLAVILLSVRHVLAGYLGNRLLRETGEILGGILDR